MYLQGAPTAPICGFYTTLKGEFNNLFNEIYAFKIFIIYVRKINNFREINLRYFCRKNKPHFNFILPKI